MAWKLVNIPIELIEKLEAYMAKHKIEVYWRAIDHLLKDEENGESETKTKTAEQPARTG